MHDTTIFDRSLEGMLRKRWQVVPSSEAFAGYCDTTTHGVCIAAAQCVGIS